MTISYGITVCNELEEIKRLIDFLLIHKRTEDNIVVLQDIKHSTPEITEYLTSLTDIINYKTGEFVDDFSAFKNQLKQYCTGDYIFFIDADEIPAEDLIQTLPEVLELNPEMEVFLVARINTVENITPELISKWGWKVNEQGHINYPDWQLRITKNTPEIKWVKPVHEVLDGFKTYTMLPDIEYFSLYHPKTIEKQIKQNTLYENL